MEWAAQCPWGSPSGSPWALSLSLSPLAQPNLPLPQGVAHPAELMSAPRPPPTQPTHTALMGTETDSKYRKPVPSLFCFNRIHSKTQTSPCIPQRPSQSAPIPSLTSSLTTHTHTHSAQARCPRALARAISLLRMRFLLLSAGLTPSQPCHSNVIFLKSRTPSCHLPLDHPPAGPSVCSLPPTSVVLSWAGSPSKLHNSLPWREPSVAPYCHQPDVQGCSTTWTLLASPTSSLGAPSHTRYAPSYNVRLRRDVNFPTSELSHA